MNAEGIVTALGGRRGNSGMVRCVAHEEKTPRLRFRDPMLFLQFLREQDERQAS
jgi:hypothetical protein